MRSRIDRCRKVSRNLRFASASAMLSATVRASYCCTRDICRCAASGSSFVLWIVYSSNVGDKTAISQFSLSLLLGLLPTLAFLITVWLAAWAGLKLVSMILMGYGVWAIGASLLYLLRNILGVK